MTPRELQAALSRQINQASGSFADDITSARADSFDRYMGEPYGDEVKDRSSVVSTDVSDTVEWIMPSLMEVFTSGDKVCTFEAVGPEDEIAADQETDAVNHVFYRQNEGWLALYSFIKDGLIQKVGYMKRIWEEREIVRTEEYSGMGPDDLMRIAADLAEKGAEVETLQEEMRDDGMYAEIRISYTDKRLKVEPVPPEEILVSPRWKSIILDDCPFVSHRRTLMVSDLIEMGYNRKQAESLPDAYHNEYAEETVDRHTNQGGSEYDVNEEMDTATREVTVHECYFLADLNGDGVAELNKAMVGGEGYELLKLADKSDGALPAFEGYDVEEVEAIPITAWTPVIIPHKHYGRSVAELIEDLQRIKTVLFRQMLDNIYISNNPTREIAESGIGESTIADLLVDRPGKIIRTTQPGMYKEHAPAPFMHQMIPAIEYVDGVRETRTGVSRYNQGLDADSLNKTATGIQRIMSAGDKKIALLARICAEVGLKHLFRGIHGDLRRHGGKQMTIKLRNEFVSIDPQSWRERDDMTIAVGLGNTDRQEKMQYLSLIIQEQKEHLMHGSPLVGMDNLFNSYEKFVEGAGFKTATTFFTDPEGQEQQQQPQQDPTQALLEVEAAKTQARMAEKQMEIEADLVKARMEDDRQRDKTNMEMALRVAEINAKAETQITMEQIKAQTRQASVVNTL